MKLALPILALGAVLSSMSAYAQIPPPPPGAAGVRMEGADVERREMRRIIIRGEEGGPSSMHRMRQPGGDLLGAYGVDPRMIMRVADALELTPQQRGKMTELVAAASPEMRKTARSIREESRRLANLDAGDAKFASGSAAMARKMGELTTSLVQQGAELRAEAWQVLTPDQRKRATEMRERMRDRMKDRMPRRGGERFNRD